MTMKQWVLIVAVFAGSLALGRLLRDFIDFVLEARSPS
jgi:hypothetical protein